MKRRASLFLATLLSASPVVGQVRGEVKIEPAPAGPAGAAPAPADGALAGKESNQGVYVRDSAVAVEKFALAQRMERLKDWNKAADALQEVIEKHADRVMPSQVDQKNVIYQYTSVTTAVQERLAKWPQEGLDVYRARFEPQAAALLEQASADDVGALHRAYALYFVTDTGKNAGLRLVDLYLESGEFPAAAWLAERMLNWHPMIDAERPKLIYRAALAYHLSGDAKSAAAKLDELKTKFADAKSAVRGQEVALAGSLAKELQTAPPVARGASGDSWPMLGGAPDRGRIPDAGGRLGALINFTEYARSPRVRVSPQLDQRAADTAERRTRDEGTTLGVMPVVDRGEMFFQDNARIYAVSLETGVVLPGWAATYGDRGGRYVAPGAVAPLPPNQHFTVTVTDNAVLAVTGQPDAGSFVNQGIPMPVDRDTRLVCLDRATGKERWAVTPKQLPESAAALRTLGMSGSPLVVGDNVYILGRGGKPMQFSDSYVLCFSLRDGSFRWSCYLASGNADPNNMQGMMGVFGENVTHLAYASGRLYALTNLGALAAIDAYSGTIVWLNIYPRPKPDFSELRGRWNRAEAITAPAKPWHHNPVIVKDGRVFILPDDAQHLLVYDAGSGVEIKRIRTGDYENAKTLLGVIGERMILCSDKSVFGINWLAYEPQTAKDHILWNASFQKQGFKANDTIRGRGFVTSDSVFVPTAWALFRLSLKGGRIEQSYPRERIWDNGEGPGNVLVTQDHVVLATSDRVNVYTDLAVARERLDAGVAAAPNDPEPRLRYAEMMFVSNQLDVALAKLDEAMALLGHGDAASGGAMRPGPARDRVFNIALTFAQKLAEPEVNKPEERKLAELLFDRAASAANSPAQQVNYRMTRARFAEPPERVRLYQEVLADADLRAVPYAADEQGATQAEAVAENAIRQIIGTVGRDAYAPFDVQAADAMARAGTDPDALRAVARSFPNAKVAPAAMIAAAEAYEAAGNARRATQMLNEAYRRYRASVDVSAIIEAQVRNYLKLPDGVGTAIGRLAQAPKGSKLRKALTLPDGSTLQDVSFGEVAQALHRYNSTAAAEGLADFFLPPDNSLRDENGKRIKAFRPEQPDTAIADVDMLVVPRRGFARHDRIITWTEIKGLAIYPVGQANPVGSHVQFPDRPRGSAWVDDDRVLVWGTTRATLLSGKTGAALWEAALNDFGGVEVAAAGETVVDALPPGVNDAEQMMIERRNMNLRLRAQQGRLVGNVVIGGAVNALGAPGDPAQPQQQPAPGEQIDQVRIAGDRAIFASTTGRVVGLDLSTGKPAWQTRLVDGPITQLLANDDFTVARFSDPAAAQIAVLDTFTGQPAGPRRVFPTENARQPVNMALSPDGTLVWTTPGQLCGKYLFEPGKELNFQVPEQPDNNPRYMNATLPEQLVIANGQILVVTDNGQYVRVHALEDGKPTADSKPLFTGAQAPGVTLRTLGSRLYVVHPTGAVSYNLDRPSEDKWGLPPGNIQPKPSVRDAMIGRDYLVLIDQLGGAAPAAPNLNRNAGAAPAQPAPARQAYRLLAYSRAAIKREDGEVIESGRIDYWDTISSPAGISSEWQGVNRGFYYRTLDRTVRFLQGARQ